MEFSYSQTENFEMEKLSCDTGYFKKPVEINRGLEFHRGKPSASLLQNSFEKFAIIPLKSTVWIDLLNIQQNQQSDVTIKRPSASLGILLRNWQKLHSKPLFDNSKYRIRATSFIIDDFLMYVLYFLKLSTIFVKSSFCLFIKYENVLWICSLLAWT